MGAIQQVPVAGRSSTSLETCDLTFYLDGSSILGLMITRTFHVDEIHCTSCENTIRTALSRLPGVAVVVPSAERNDVRVSFDDAKVAEDQLRTTLGDAGFEPRP